MTVAARQLVILLAVANGRCLAAAPTFEEMMRLGREALAASRFDEAIRNYEAALVKAPGHPGAALNLCIAAHSAGRYEKAVDWCGKATPAPARLFEGLSLLKLKRTQEALAPLEKFLTVQPKQPTALLELANAYLILGDGARALRHFNQLRDLVPTNAKAWQGIGMSQLRLSEEIYEKEVSGSAAWHALTGLALLDQGQSQRAFAHLRKALELNSLLAGAHTAIAEIYRRTGHPEWAEVELGKERGSETNKAYEDALGHSQAALEAFAQLARLPESAEALEVQGAAERARKRFPESAHLYAKAVNRTPGDVRLETEYARALYLARDYDKALPLLEKHGLLYEAGVVRLESGDVLGAISALEECVRREPNFSEVRAKLGEAYLKNDEWGKAVEQLSAAAPKDRDGRIHLLLSRAYQRSGDGDRARAAQARYQKLSAQSVIAEPEGEVGPP